MIAKIERKAMNPSYESVRKIFSVLQAELGKQNKRVFAEDVCTAKLASISSTDTVSRAITLMRDHGYSQLPVIDEGTSVGSVADKTVTAWLLKGRELLELSRMRVEEVMDPAFPQVDGKTPIDLVASLLEHYSAVLVTRRGTVKGIVTKSDLLKLV